MIISPLKNYENANIVAKKFSCPAMLSKNEFAIVSNMRFIGTTSFILS